jgi:hypothetical protein
MPFAVTQLPGEPIIIVYLQFPVEEYLGSIRLLKDEIAEIADHTDSPLYTIYDLEKLTEFRFSDISLLHEEARQGPAGSPADPRLRPCIAGTHPLIPVAVNKANQQLGSQMIHCETVEQALAWARAAIAAEAGDNHASPHPDER